MANRINGNVIIVDSAMGNAFVLNSADLVVNLDEVKVSAFGFWSVDTTSAISLTQANTATDIVFIAGWQTNGAGASVFPRTSIYSFSEPVRFGNLKVPLLTACTGFIYLA